MSVGRCTDTLGQRAARLCLWFVAGLTLLFLLLPVFIVLPISFSEGSFISYPVQGFSLRWYASIFERYPWMFSIRNSLAIALAATALATALGTLAAWGLISASFPGKPALMGLLISPIVMPLVITALAVYFMFARLGILHTYTGLILAHTVLAAPYVVITVTATLQTLDPALVRAAASLGAAPLEGFRTVTLPLIAPGVVSGAVFAFVTSFDDVVVALFLAGPTQATLPLQLFSRLRDHLDPAIIAVAALLTLTSIGFMLVIELLNRRTRRLRASEAT
jgi:putative spermidine/putrescine transport system permease protein